MKMFRLGHETMSLLKNKHVPKKVHTSRLNTNGSNWAGLCISFHVLETLELTLIVRVKCVSFLNLWIRDA